MWLSLFCLAALLAIAFFQSIHGMFSSLIFFVLAVISAVLAFALYEWIAYSFLMQWKPDFALPIALGATFGLSLTILRLVMDQVISRSGLMPALVDKLGGALFGVFTSLIIVGVLATAVQMLPFDRTVLGFARFEQPATGDEDPDRAKEFENATAAVAGEGNDLILKPDRFAVGFVSLLSRGVFSGEQSFSSDHPDLMTEIGWSQCVPSGSRHLAEPDSVHVQSVRVIDFVYKKQLPARDNPETKYEPVRPQGNREYWLVNLSPGNGAQDADGTQRFKMPQIRLVGRDGYGDPVQFIPCAVRDTEHIDQHITETLRGSDQISPVLSLWQPNEDGTVEVVFDVPKDFEPRFLAYKTGARVAIKKPTRNEGEGA